MSAPLAILRRLRRTVRYAALESLIGRTIFVRSAETALVDVMNEVGGLLPLSSGVSRSHVRERVTTLAKYGIFDLTWVVVERSVSVPLAGLRILGEFGLLDKSSEDLLEDGDTEGGDIFLNDLADAAERGTIYLMLFLRDARARDHLSIPYRLEGRAPSQAVRPAGSFLVQDACLTNAESIWLFKHFYL